MQVKATSTPIEQFIAEANSRLKEGEVLKLKGPNSEIEFTLENWNRLQDEFAKVIEERRKNNLDLLSFIKKLS